MTHNPNEDLGEVEALAAKMPEAPTSTSTPLGWTEEVVQPEVKRWEFENEKVKVYTTYDDSYPQPYSVRVDTKWKNQHGPGYMEEFCAHRLESADEAKAVAELILKRRELI